MHLTICCRFLICCVGGGEQGGKVSGQGHKVWALDGSSKWHKGTDYFQAHDLLFTRQALFNELSHGSSQ
jgi:hypothetical protein